MIWAVLAVALALRLLAIEGAVDNPFGDAADFLRHAVSIVEGGQYPVTGFAEPGSPTALRPPGYPLLLAATGADVQAARIVNALLGTAAVGLLYLLVLRVLRDRRIALLAAGIATVLPSLVLVGSGLLSENLFVPLTLATALLVALQRDRGGLALAAAAGAVLGLAVLTRTNGLALALPVAIGLWGGGSRRWLAPAVAGVALVVVLAPWTVRNAILFERFLPLGTQSGFTMAGQWNGVAADPGPDRAAWVAPPSQIDHQDLMGKPGLDEGDVDAELRSRAIEFAAEHPAVAPTALFLNLQRSFGVHVAHGTLDHIAYAEMGVPPQRWEWLRLSTYALALLALAGAIVALRRRCGPLWLWLFGLLLIASYVVWLGTPRYRVPLDPFLAILAAVAISRVRRPRRAPGAPGSS